MRVEHKQAQFELTEPQTIFSDVVEEAIRKMKEDGFDGLAQGLAMYWFHEPNQVSVDGLLFDVFNYGYQAYNLRGIRDGVDKALEEAGYTFEYETYADLRFYKKE